MVNMDDTVVLVTVVGRKDVKPGQDFFPLTVDYQERTYAAGKIPGGFFKREGRPSEKEILTSRLIDRPIRPLFPGGILQRSPDHRDGVSSNNEVDSDIPAMIGASAALALSGIPFDGPIGAARVGYIDGEYVLNPTATELKTSQLNLVVAGTKHAVLMVESEAMELAEDVMLGAVVYGHQQMQPVIDTDQRAGRRSRQADVGLGSLRRRTAAHRAHCRRLPRTELREAYRPAAEAGAQRERWSIDPRKVLAEMPCPRAQHRARQPGEDRIFSDIESKIVRSQILNGEPRIDGRDTRTVRPITVRAGVLPRTHGSALFTRGETQSLAVATLGTARDEQIIDALQGEYTRALHASLQHAALFDRRNRPCRHAEAARSRPRTACQARAACGAAVVRGVFLFDARGFRNHRIQRLQFDGIGVRRLPGADGCRRAAQGARCRASPWA